MPTIKGRDSIRKYLDRMMIEIEEQVLPGAARAAAKVIANRAKENLGSKSARVKGGGKMPIADAVKVKVRRTKTGHLATVYLKGPSAYPAKWLEYGTSPHFISVDPNYRQGMTARRINTLDRKAEKEGRTGPGHSLFIGGKAVGTTVHHDGADPYPFLRPAMDHSKGDAIAAAQAYIHKRLTKHGIGHNGGPPLLDKDDE